MEQLLFQPDFVENYSIPAVAKPKGGVWKYLVEIFVIKNMREGGGSLTFQTFTSREGPLRYISSPTRVASQYCLLIQNSCLQRG